MSNFDGRPPLTVSRPELLVNGSDQTFREFIHNFLAFTRLVALVRDKFGELLGLSGAQYEIFITICHQQGEQGISVRDVAQHLHVSGAFVTTETRKLVEMGVISKVPNPEDRRGVLLSVTEKGRELLATLATIQRPVNDTLFECLDAKEFMLIARRLTCFIESGQQAYHQVAYLSQLPENSRLFETS